MLSNPHADLKILIFDLLRQFGKGRRNLGQVTYLPGLVQHSIDSPLKIHCSGPCRNKVRSCIIQAFQKHVCAICQSLTLIGSQHHTVGSADADSRSAPYLHTPDRILDITIIGTHNILLN